MNAGENKWIFAHRGIWTNKIQQNTFSAISSAIVGGFAVESDFRDLFGRLVISHDPPLEGEYWNFDNAMSKSRFAYNIKSDGLIPHFNNFIDSIRYSNSFVFDGSVPEMFKARKYGIPHALRLSEFETELPWYSDFIWIDGFESDWWLRKSEIIGLLEEHQLIFVSPEIHGRDHKGAFEWFTELRKSGLVSFSVCTDFPIELKDLNGA
jgi:hypothetical protein